MSASYVWVIGHGGSGTKRVTNLLDLSPETHVRYINQHVTGSPQSRLPDTIVRGPGHGEAMEAHWDEMVAWSHRSWSVSDRLPPKPKRHIRASAWTRAAWAALARPRLRRALSVVCPGLGRPEQALGGVLADAERLSASKLVIKTNQVPAWAIWVLEHRRECGVVHVVRHPAGVLRAWRTRLAHPERLAAIARDSADRHERIRASDPEWKAVMPAASGLDAASLELWFWRYCTETTHRVGRGLAGYQLVLDERVWSRPLAVAEELFAFAGLPKTEALEKWIGSMAAKWRSHTMPWRAALSSGEAEAVSAVLGDSVLSELWPEDQEVSTSAYQAY